MSHEETDQLRIPPQNAEAEMAVLGSIIQLNETIDDISSTLKPNHFYSEANQTTFTAMVEMWDRGVRGIDSITLAAELDQRGELVEVGGADYIADITTAVPDAAHVKHYAQIVFTTATRRKCLLASSQLATLGYDASSDIENTIAEVESIVGSLRYVNDTEQRHVSDVMAETVSNVEERMASDSGIAGIPTGFSDLDAQISGLVGPELLVLAARPSMGKTALAVNIAAHVARTHPVLFFSLEQEDSQLTERIACSESRVNSHDVRNGNLTEPQIHRFRIAAAAASKLKLTIDDTGKRTMQDIAAICRKRHRIEPLGVVIIDYLQLISPSNDKAPREQQVSAISRALKMLAKDLKAPVIVLSQLNRGVENREDKRPRLADLRESGAIEQDADVVMFLYRADAYDAEERPGEAEVIVSKSRSGPTGLARLTWRKEFMRFENYVHTAADGDFLNSPRFDSDN